MSQAMLYVVAGVTGAVSWHFVTKWLFRLMGKKQDRAQQFVRDLPPNAFRTFYLAFAAESDRRQAIQAETEDSVNPSRGAEESV